MPDQISLSKAKHHLVTDAKRLGFSDIKVAKAQSDAKLEDDLKAFVAQNHHGTMGWLASDIKRRAQVKNLWSEAQSIILLAMSYAPDHDPLENYSDRDIANISVYARHRDYHDVIKGRLKEIAGRFASKTGADVKVFVDTAPIMEKPLAQSAGLGWQGKHTNLVSRDLGSWFFIGSIFTTADLEPDQAETDHCGSCRACLDSCPTDAFPAPYKIDARRCISYLTIEHKGPIAHEFRNKMGNRIYGCDDCLAACPWNKFASEAHEIKLQARKDLIAPKITELLTLDDQAFRKLFSGSPIKRIGRDRFIRNVLIAAGNSNNTAIAEYCRPHLDDPNAVVRGTAVWALSQLLSPHDIMKLQDKRKEETDMDVLREWKLAIERAEACLI